MFNMPRGAIVCYVTLPCAGYSLPHLMLVGMEGTLESLQTRNACTS